MYAPTKQPGRRTHADAHNQAYHCGRTGSLCLSGPKPLTAENLLYLEALREQAVEWAVSIQKEIDRITAERDKK